MRDLEKELISMVEKDVELIGILKTVRSLDLSDAYVGAGAIRNLVWDYLHGYNEKSPLTDIDVVYFDSKDINTEKDLGIWKKLCDAEPRYEWNVFNQARGHIKNNLKKAAKSTKEGMATWPETPTCVGVRINEDDSFDICAPYGLDDLMNLRIHPCGNSLIHEGLYEGRIAKKKWKETWPKLEIHY